MEIKNVCQGGQNTQSFNLNSNAADNNIAVDGNSYSSVKAERDVSTVGGKKISEKDVEKAVEKLNKLMDESSTHVEYEIHGKFKDIMIKIVDNNTKEVIKEVPPKKILDMVAKLCEIAGVLIDQKA